MDSELKSRFVQCFGDLLSTRNTQHFETFGYLHLHKCEDGKSLGIFDRDCNGKHSHFVLIHTGENSLIDSLENDNNNNNSVKVEPQKPAHSTPEDKSVLNISESCLGGSPLKLQVYADLSTFDSSSLAPTPISSGLKRTKSRQRTGLPLRKARILASLYMACAKMAKHKGETTLPPLWILCDTEDLRSTAALGVEHLSSASKDGSHSFKTSMVSLQGRSVVDSQHRSLPWQSPGTTHAEAVYDVLDSKVEDRVGYQGTLTLHLAWQDAFLLLQPPSLDAMATIRVATFPGDVRSPVFSLYQELKMLQGLVAAMTTGEVVWAEEEGETPLLESVRSLLDWLKTGHAALTHPTPALDSSELATSPDLPDFKERQDFDFTDHIWKVFLKCSSFNEMTQCLRYVFAALIRREVQPMVTRSNQTTMAQMVRETYQDRLSMPSLSGVFPLRLLAEVGVEKLKKDYAHAFIAKGWSTMGLLENYLSGSQELQAQVEWLEKLHQALETVVMLQVFLKLPQNTLGAVARHLLQHYKTATPVPGQVLELPVAASTVSTIFQSYPPCQWGVEVQREIGGVQEVSGLMLSTTQPFCHVPLPPDEKSSLSDTTVSTASGTGDKTLYYTLKREEKVLM